MSTTRSTGKTTSIAISSSTEQDKYHGILVTSRSASMNRLFFDFCSYCEKLVPNNKTFSVIFFVWISVIYIISSMCIQSPVLFPKDNSIAKALSYLTILQRIIPPTVSNNYFFVFSLVMIILQSLYTFTFMTFLMYFNKRAKFPLPLASVIVFYSEGPGIVLLLIYFSNAGHRIVDIWSNGSFSSNLVVSIIFLLNIIIGITIIKSLADYKTPVLTFRNSPFATYFPKPGNILYFSFILISFFGSAVGSSKNQSSNIIYGSVMFFIFLGISLLCLLSLTFISSLRTSLFTGFSLAGAIISLISTIFTIIKKPISQEIILLEFALIAILPIVVQPIHRFIRLRSYSILDQIQDNSATFDTFVKNCDRALQIAAYGFEIAHPIVLSWEYIKMCHEKWPDSPKVLWLWARLVACFPDKNSDLHMILGYFKTLSSRSYNKHSKSNSFFRYQIKLLSRERQDSMTAAFKKNIEKLNSLSAMARNKQRRFWECVIQGNLADMEASAYGAKNAISEAEIEAAHLTRKYPNNQYVARAISKFLLKVKGDKTQYALWSQNYMKLKSGQKIVEDRAELFGHETFPLILSFVREHTPNEDDGYDPRLNESSIITQSTINQFHENDYADEDDLFVSVKNSINNVSLPAVRNSIFLTSIAFLVCFGIVILSLTYPSVRSRNLSKIVGFTGDCSMININSIHLCILAAQYCLETTLGYSFDNISPEIAQTQEKNILAFGESDRVDVQCSFAVNLLNSYTQSLRSIFLFSKSGNSDIAKAQSLLFESTISVATIDVLSYSEGGTDSLSLSYSSKSIQAAASYVGLLATNIIKANTQTLASNMIKTSPLPTMINHTLAVNEAIMKTIQYFNKEVNSDIYILKYIQIYIVIIGSIIGVILVISVAIVEFIMLKKQVSTVSRAFLTLPKHAVSNIVESLKVNIESDDDINSSNSTDVGRNKQEENYLAMLASTSESSLAASLPLRLLVCSAIFFGILFVSCLIYQYYSLFNAIDIIRTTTPHASNIPQSYASGAICLLTLLRIGAIKFSHQFPGDTLQPLIYLLKDQFDLLKNYLFNLRVGNLSSNLSPVVSLDEKISEKYHKSLCQINTSNNIHDFYNCFSPDMKLGQLESWLGEITGVLIEKGQFSILNGTYNHMIHILFKHLYEEFVSPFDSYIKENAYNFFSKRIRSIIIVTIVFLFAIICCTIIEWWTALRIEHESVWMLELLLHCPPDVILASKNIVKILNGDFTDHQVRTVEHDTHFYENIVEKFIDLVMITDSNLIISKANPAAEKFFNKQVLGLCITDLFPEESDAVLEKRFRANRKVSANPSGIYANTVKKVQNIKKSQPDKKKNDKKAAKKAEEKEDGEVGTMREFMKIYKRALEGGASLKISQDIEYESAECTTFFNISLSAMGKSGILSNITNTAADIDYLVIVARNITQSIRSKRLLREEKDKSDKLLRHILPPMIVEGLKRGERDISFAVPSASILFLDIVEFTPWCASLQASQVMATLNRLFCELDTLIAKYLSLTKMKCIGDCYMAAGGIFSATDGCSPSQHAREMVSFGVDAILGLERVNAEINQKLKIRVGINTGGPIVAGVLGVDRPTFEIFGPPITMAQQMEHHGLPMHVQISQSVYELVFGQNFKIKERGQIEIKQGLVTTYLVTP